MAVVKVPDDRLDRLAVLVNARKTTYIEALGLEHEPDLAQRLVELAETARGQAPPVPPPHLQHPLGHKQQRKRTAAKHIGIPLAAFHDRMQLPLGVGAGI